MLNRTNRVALGVWVSAVAIAGAACAGSSPENGPGIDPQHDAGPGDPQGAPDANGADAPSTHDGGADAIAPRPQGGRACPTPSLCWENPLPQGEPLKGVHGTAPDDVWAVGDAGMILWWGGTAWTPIPSGTAETLTAVFAAARDDVWISGTGGTMLHVTASKVERIDVGTLQDISGVWGSGPNDIWATTNSPAMQTTGGGAFLHWDGATWTQTPAQQASFQGLWGSAADDIWVNANVDNTLGANVIVHFDGHEWTQMAGPSAREVEPFTVGFWGGKQVGGIWMAAAGYNFSTLNFWDGHTWFTDYTKAGVFLGAIWGSAADDVWAVGEGQTAHWTGAGATLTDSVQPNGFGGRRAIWGTGRDDVWQVGKGGLIAHGSGGSWNVVSSGEGASGTGGRALMGSGADDVWDVGPGRVLHYDGARWKVADVGGSPDGGWSRIWVGSKTSAWLLGDSGDVRHWNGTEWSALPSLSLLGSFGETSIWASAENDVWVSTEGSLHHWNGTDWANTYSLPTPCGSVGGAMWGRDANDVWLASPYAIQHVVGGFAHPSCSIDTTVKGVTNVRGRAADDIWAVGKGGVIYHYDGHAWTATPSGTTVDLTSVWASGPNDAWAAGAGPSFVPGEYATVLVHWNGAQWSEVEGAREIAQVWGADAQNVWFAGDYGRVLRYVP
jgi:hypothetical protein